MSQTKVKSGLLNFPDQTDFVKLPSGTTAQRPVSPEKGYSRYNTTDNKLEFWNGTLWQQLPGVVAPTIETVSYPGDDLAADPAGGQTITLTGTNFLAGASIEIGGTLASVVTVVSKTEITFEAPAKAAGDYDIFLTNGDNTTATFVNGISYNGVPSWTTPAGNLGSFPAGSTIPTITLVATEPDSGVISYSVTTGALPTGLTLTGANIDGNVPTPAGETTYNFSVTASDDENQSTERSFNIVVYLQVTNTVSEVDPFGDSSGVALYKLDGDATDESGNYNGNFVNASYTAGIFGQAGEFNANNKYMDSLSPIGISASNANDDVTVSTWIKFNSVITTGAIALFGIPGTGTGAFHIYLYGHADGVAISFERSFDNKAHYADGYNTQMKYPFVAGVWYNLVTTYVGSTKVAKAYVNGSKVPNTLTLIQRSTNANTSQTIRMGVDGTSFSINASIDQVRIFNKLLTPLEISSLYEERTVVCGGQAETVDILGDNSCIALYPLDGNANDLSGNYSGTPTDVSYGVGEFDLAGVFNGSSSKVDISSLSIPLNNFSYSLWFKANDTSSYQILILHGNGGRSYGVQLNNDANIGSYMLNSSAGTEYLLSNSITIDTNWHNVVITKSSTQGHKIYYDGNNIATDAAFTGNLLSGNFSNFLGSSGTSGYFNGSIDQVRIFNKALSAGEVTTLYNETACDVLACSGTTNTLDILGDGSCIAAYPLDGSPLDLSGNYNGVQTDVTYPVGKFDLAGSFNGSTSIVSLPNNFTNSFNTSPNGFAVSFFWYNNDLSGQVIPFYFSYGAILGIDKEPTNNLRVLFNDGTTNKTFNVTNNLTTGTWQHIVVTGNTTNGLIMYIDGVSVGNTTWNGNHNTSATTSNTIGHPSVSINGKIDQFRVFNKYLNTTEITTLYNETACN